MDRNDARLLVVDDEPVSGLATHHALRGLGCRRIDEARTGSGALQLLSEQPYDLVISNWRMRIMSGAELLSLIRRTPRLATIPVVIATFVTPKIVAEAAEAGVSAFLPRPFRRESLDEVLRIYIGPRVPSYHLAAPLLRLVN